MNIALIAVTLALGLVLTVAGVRSTNGLHVFSSNRNIGRGATLNGAPSTSLRSAAAKWLGCICCLVSAALASPANASTPYSFTLPYAWWTFPESRTVLETDIQILSDPSTAANSDVQYFLAHQFSIVGGEGYRTWLSGGYVGLQTQVWWQGMNYGEGIMFSIFDSATFVTNKVSFEGANCEDFGHEGLGMHCFMPYPWDAGKRYRLRVQAFPDAIASTTSYTASVTDMSVNPPATVTVGTIAASPDSELGDSSVQWLEYYGPPRASCADYPYVKVLWSPPQEQGLVTYAAGNALSDGYCKNTNVWNTGNNRYQEAGTPAGWSIGSIRSNSGYYLRATKTAAAGCGGSNVSVNSTAVGDCERFTRIPLASGKVAWQTEDGYRLTCTGGGGSTVRATARTISGNESFRESAIVSGGATAYTYRTSSGYYLSVTGSGGNRVLSCNSRSVGTNQLFFPGSAP